MTTKEILPLPESTYQLLLDAATWNIATRSAVPGRSTPPTWTYAESAGTVMRIAGNGVPLGAARRRGYAVQRQHQHAVCGHAGRAGRRDRRPGQPRTVQRADHRAGPPHGIPGPGRSRSGSLDPQLWSRLLEVARQAGITAVLALRPDGARGDPPVLGPASDGGPDGRPLTVAYLDEVIAGQPSGHLAGADLPTAGDLAAFVHTGKPTGAPRSPRTPTPTSWPRPGDRRVQWPGARGGDAGRAAAVPRQRPDRHRHRPDVRRHPGRVARPGR